MTIDELNQLIAQGESETLELKKSTGQRSRAMETLCAMLNGEGGSVVLGVNDQGVACGQQVTTGTLQDVHNELGKITPAVMPDIGRVPLPNGLEAIVLTVEAGTAVYTYDGRAYMRRGPVTTRMPLDALQQLLERRANQPSLWGRQPAEGVTLEDLDASEIVRTVDDAVRTQRLDDPVTREIPDLLTGLGLMQDGRILNGAVVLFGRPAVFLPRYVQCLLKLARFAGTGKDEFLDNRQEHGNAFDLFIRAQRFLRDHLPVASRFEPDAYVRTDIPAIPTAALREAIANALCHRDYTSGAGSVDIAVYADRVEITNIGQLHFGLTPEALRGPHPSKPWNPAIANAFYRRGVIETWGRGTNRICELVEAAGLPAPEFFVQPYTVGVRFTFAPSPTGKGNGDRGKAPVTAPVTAPVGEYAKRMLELLARQGPMGNAEIRDAFGLKSRRRLRETYIAPALAQDLIEMTIPDKPRSSKQKYRLTDSGRQLLDSFD